MMWLFLLGMTDQKTTPDEKMEKEVCSMIPSQQTLFQMSKRYYEKKGVWAGVFWLDSAQQERVVVHNEKELSYHLHYLYVPIPNNRRFRTDSGYDQRIFFFACDKEWTVRDMGPYMSASFPQAPNVRK